MPDHMAHLVRRFVTPKAPSLDNLRSAPWTGRSDGDSPFDCAHIGPVDAILTGVLLVGLWADK